MKQIVHYSNLVEGDRFGHPSWTVNPPILTFVAFERVKGSDWILYLLEGGGLGRINMGSLSSLRSGGLVERYLE